MSIKSVIILSCIFMCTKDMHQDDNKLPKKPLISDVIAYNMYHLNALKIGMTKDKVLDIMKTETITAYVSKDWKDYLTGFEKISIANPSKIELFTNDDGDEIIVFWYYASLTKTDRLIPIRLKNNELVRIGLAH